MAQAMACSTMQMLCVVEPRHAAVLLRAGAAPLLVASVRGSAVDECVRGNAAGVLASLAQLRDCQVGCKVAGACADRLVDLLGQDTTCEAAVMPVAVKMRVLGGWRGGGGGGKPCRRAGQAQLLRMSEVWQT